MLSGQIPPISANFNSNSPFIVEDDENFQLDLAFENEKLLDEQSQQENRSKWNQTKSNNNPNIVTTNKLTTTQVSRNISNTNNNQSSQSTTTSTAATSGIILTTTTTATTVPHKINQNQQQQTIHDGASNSNSSSCKTQVSVTPSTGATPKTITRVANTKRPSNDTSGRSAALERAYVHDVYENCEEPTGAIRPRVAQFLAGLDPGSIVCDVGCGNGRYLTSCNPLICTVGADRCHRLTNVAREKGGEVALCDNLELPFRDESFDAVLSLAVVHHFATTERRVGAIRELARILRIGGRVVITVWALEQRHRRFESQDVLIPWQPPKNRNITYSDEEDDDDYLPPYHAYTEDSTNSSRSAGDGDSSSLSSSSPGESCYSFVRRAIQKLAGGRRHPWFLDSWNSKDTKNDSSLDYEDAKDLPIELRRLEDFEDFPDPPLSAGLKSRSLGSILNPPPRQIVRSRSSVPSLGAQMSEQRQQPAFLAPQQQLSTFQQQSAAHSIHNQSLNSNDSNNCFNGNLIQTTMSNSISTTTPLAVSTTSAITTSATGSSDRRPKLIKQKQSLCDDDYQLPDNPFHMISSNNYNSNYSLNNSYKKNSSYFINGHTTTASSMTSNKLRKQSSLNEELMAANRLREKERVRKRIQKQMSLNEAFLCRSMFSKRLQIIREGFTSKLKTSTGSLERVTKNSIVKIMKNFKPSQFSTTTADTTTTTNATTYSSSISRDHPLCKQNSVQHKQSCPFYVCGPSNTNTCSTSSSAMSGPTTLINNSISAVNCSCNNFNNNLSNVNEDQQQEAKLRRHSRESGSDSSKDSSLQSDTSIESEDSFASVIFIPKPEQQQQQKIYQQHNNSNSSSSNSSSSNGTNSNYNNCISNYSKNRIPSVPTSPLIMPCPPTPAHSPAAANSTITSPPQAMAAVTAAMSIFSPQKLLNNHNINYNNNNNSCNIHHYNSHAINSNNCNINTDCTTNGYMQGVISRNRFTFDEEHIIEQQKENSDVNVAKITVKEPLIPSMGAIQKQPLYSANNQQPSNAVSTKQVKITRQLIKDLPQIPKFRRPQSKNSYPIIRRTSASQAVPKLMSLELFNPATDDLDSDSSEPSSPDSVDSVINALIPCAGGSDDDEKQKLIETIELPKDETKDLTDSDNSLTKIQQQKAFFHSMDDQGKKQRTDSKMLVKQHSLDLKTNHEPIQPFLDNCEAKITNGGDTIYINEVENDSNLLICKNGIDEHQYNSDSSTTMMAKVSKNSHRDCADFAEQLSAQLMREIDDNIRTEKIDCRSLDGIGDIGEFIDDPFTKKRNNGEYRDLTALREELRERRLMLANLSTQHSQQQSPTSSSTSSLSSQTRSFTIHEEDEEEDEADADANSSSSYSLNLYDSCKISKFKYKRNRHYNLNPETAYLLQDDCDSSVRDDDDDDIEHDVILEEDEDEVETDDRVQANGHFGEYCRKTSRNTIKCNEESLEESLETTTAGDNNAKKIENSNRPNENRQSTESWEHSNSSTSLDSPSQGGATTHHRYYHVFREGELDALINHHVTSLHIVSSYYERASWCVVAEKVQVWTI